MTPLKASAQTIRVLREIVALWPVLRPKLLAGTPAAPPPPVPSSGGSAGDGSAWFQIVSASSVGTNQWNYKGRLMKSGSTSAYTGLTTTSETTQYDLRNAYESVALGGLSDVSALKVIATNSIVRAWPEIRNNVRVFVFERPNDIECS